MSLVFRVGIRHVNRIISELRNPLKTGGAQRAAHGRIQMRIHHIGRIKFIYHQCFLPEIPNIGKRNVIRIYMRQEIPFASVPRYQSGRIPLIGCSLNSRVIIRLNYVLVVTYVIEHRLFIARFLERTKHSVDVTLCLLFGAGVTRFVVNLKPDDVRIVFVTHPRVRIHMIYQRSDVPLLSSNGFGILVNIALIVIIRITTRGLIPFRVTIAEIGLCRHNNAYSPLTQTHEQVIQ